MKRFLLWTFRLLLNLKQFNYIKVYIDYTYYFGMKTKTGRGARGACGGKRRRDGSGAGRGNVGTSRQPSKRK